MTTYNRPSEQVAKHATRLKAEFDMINHAVDANNSDSTLLPSELESRILVGIERGFKEARSKRYCPKLPKLDKSLFSQVILKNIITEAALQARDRIPLSTFHGLSDSYNTLWTKLIPQEQRDSYNTRYPDIATPLPPAATTHRAVGAAFATKAMSVVDLISAAKERQTETTSARTSKATGPNRRDGKAKEVSSEDEENQMDQDEEGADDHEVRESEEAESGDDLEEDPQEIVREQSVPNIRERGNGFSNTVILEIKEQASVNRLESMTEPEVLGYLSSSFESFLREQQLSSRSVHISATSLLDSGDVELVMHAETEKDLPCCVRSAGWAQIFENALIGPSVQVYKVKVHMVEINGLRLQNRKEKSAIIRNVAENNRGLSAGNGAKPIIRDIYWPRHSLSKVKTSLIVEFLDPAQATEALVRGLHWQGKRHGCDRADNKCRLLKCKRCQGYGHVFEMCSAPHQCGNCAGQHPTATCTSKEFKCASCGGSHYAGSSLCPVKADARRKLGFTGDNVSPIPKPAALAQAEPSSKVEHSTSAAKTQTEMLIPSPVSLDTDSAEDDINSEPDTSMPEANAIQDLIQDNGTLLKQIIEDIRDIIVARKTALKANSSGRTKRRVDEAFAGGAEAESSNMAAKRIKKE